MLHPGARFHTPKFPQLSRHAHLSKFQQTETVLAPPHLSDSKDEEGSAAGPHHLHSTTSTTTEHSRQLAGTELVVSCDPRSSPRLIGSPAHAPLAPVQAPRDVRQRLPAPDPATTSTAHALSSFPFFFCAPFDSPPSPYPQTERQHRVCQLGPQQQQRKFA